ncbi:MAG: signal peptidase II [Nanoarchaeota archaeon]|nr:signal peptidase II [Nanoarchaeota archaeon]MBU4352096.1 signal peptidase II [Nanoarchaeota archaeon]MBU4456082.1 signal peptidase II [Nanoarchaeota archaeon]
MKKILFALFLVIIDQLSKFLITNKSIEIFRGFSLKFVTNTGAAFSLFQGFNLVLVLISLIVIVYLFLQLRKEKNQIRVWSFIFIIAGALGNLIDRVIFGHVRDFILVWIWPTFNLADSFITIGALLLLYSLFSK